MSLMYLNLRTGLQILIPKSFLFWEYITEDVKRSMHQLVL